MLPYQAINKDLWWASCNVFRMNMDLFSENVIES